ncbi:MAG TPA: phosphotransferase [Candidatus Deferrimicrobium sp.]|nr:phosphotransferase [Candidatus Deferrimicrobium sp.]
MGGASKIIWPIEDLHIDQEYGLTAIRAKDENRCVLRIGNEVKDYALKSVDLKTKNLTLLDEVFDLLAQKEFQYYSPIVRSIHGEFFIKRQSGTYYLAEWIAGRESNFSSYHDLLNCTRTLAKMHLLTSGFRARAIDWKERWSSSVQKLLALESSYTLHPPLALLVRRAIEAGEKTLRLLDDPEVNQSLYNPTVVCHHDLSYRNFIINPDDQAFLIDFDYATADVPMRDLAQFFIKVLKHNNWDINVILPLISAYKQENTLSRGDLGVMIAFLSFPRSLWGLNSGIQECITPKEIIKSYLKNTARQFAVSSLMQHFSFE